MVKITGFTTRDVRFPVRYSHCQHHDYQPALLTTKKTSLDKTGSDAMNAAGDYSSAYCIIHTDSDHTGHGMVHTTLQLSSKSTTKH